MPLPDDLGNTPVSDPPAQYAAVNAGLVAPVEPARAHDLATWALTRPPPLLVLTGAQIALDAAGALIVLEQTEAAREAAKRGLKAIGQDAAADGVRLELLILLDRASPDPRVRLAIRTVAERLLPLVPQNARDGFRSRPGVAEALAGP